MTIIKIYHGHVLQLETPDGDTSENLACPFGPLKDDISMVPFLLSVNLQASPPTNEISGARIAIQVKNRIIICWSLVAFNERAKM